MSSSYGTSRPPALPVSEDRLRALARRLCRACPQEVEDCMQEGRIGAWEGIAAYDPANRAGASLSTFCGHRALSRMRHYLRDRVRLIALPCQVQQQHGQGQRRNLPEAVIGGQTWQIAREQVPDTGGAGTEAAALARVALARLLSALPCRRRRCVLLVWGQGWTLSEAGRAVGLSPSGVAWELRSAQEEARRSDGAG